MTQAFPVAHNCDDQTYTEVPTDLDYTFDLTTLRPAMRSIWPTRGVMVCRWEGACIDCGQRFRAFLLKNLVRNIQDPGGKAEAIVRVCYVNAMMGHFVRLSSRRKETLLKVMLEEIVDEDHLVKVTGHKVWLGSRTWVDFA